MADIVKAVVKNHRDTAANLTAANIIPYDGEITIESDTGNIKVGDGSTLWNSLKYTIGANKQVITSSGSVSLGFGNHLVELDLSVSNVIISELPNPDFIGQKIHFYGTGTNLGSVLGGKGVYANAVFITENTSGFRVEAISMTEWKAVESITADYQSGAQRIIQDSLGNLEIIVDAAGTTPASPSGNLFGSTSGNIYVATITIVFVVPFLSTPSALEGVLDLAVSNRIVILSATGATTQLFGDTASAPLYANLYFMGKY